MAKTKGPFGHKYSATTDEQDAKNMRLVSFDSTE